MRVWMPMILAGGLISAFFAAGVIRSQPPAAKTEEKTRTIPLESCFVTFGGGGCKVLSNGLGEPHEDFLNQLLQFGRNGSSNVALVRGNDIARAVRAGLLAFTGGYLLDAPVLPDQEPGTKTEPLWLTANLGASAAGMRRLHAAELTGRTIRLSYSTPNVGMFHDMVHHHFVWVPLGHLPKGTYTLELFDVVRKEVMQMRRVVVAQP